MAISHQYEYIDEELISECLKCKICTNPFIDPVQTKCHPKPHAFCYDCISEWLQRDLSCPSCRQDLKTEDLTSIYDGITIDLLNELPVQCLLCYQRGIERGDFNEHVNKRCVKQIVSCYATDIECPWSGPREELKKHLRKCPYIALRIKLTEIISKNKQLRKQLDEQQAEISKLQQENREMKEQLQYIPIVNPTNNYKPSFKPKKAERSKFMHVKCTDLRFKIVRQYKQVVVFWR